MVDQELRVSALPHAPPHAFLTAFTPERITPLSCTSLSHASIRLHTAALCVYGRVLVCPHRLAPRLPLQPGSEPLSPLRGRDVVVFVILTF